VTRAFPAAFEFMGYSGWPWSKTIAIDGEGETIILNRRKIPEASSADYAGTIWHELSHKAGYFHTGNGRRGNECTVPHLLGDAAVVARSVRRLELGRRFPPTRALACVRRLSPSRRSSRHPPWPSRPRSRHLPWCARAP